MWQTENGMYLDRVYYTESSEINLIINWVKEKVNITYSFDLTGYGDLKVKLKEAKNQKKFHK